MLVGVNGPLTQIDNAAVKKFKLKSLGLGQDQNHCKSFLSFCLQGYFLTVSADIVHKVAKQALQNKKLFIMNLSSVKTIETCTPSFISLLPYIDILFGNETEAQALAKALRYGVSLFSV